MDHQNRVHDGQVDPGEQIYDGDGLLLGHVSGLTDDGFEVETVSPGETDLEEVPGQEFGEGYLMWRCEECGEMGELEDGMPGSCPACGAPEEAVAAMRED